MLTIIVALFAGIFLARIFADVLKAVVVVALVIGALYISRGVTFQALIDDGAHELLGRTPRQGVVDRPTVYRRT